MKSLDGLGLETKPTSIPLVPLWMYDAIKALPALMRGIYLYDAAFFMGKQSYPLKQASTLYHDLRFVRWLDRRSPDQVKMDREGHNLYQGTP